MATIPVCSCARQNLVSSGAFLLPSYIGLQRIFLLRSPRTRGCIVLWF